MSNLGRLRPPGTAGERTDAAGPRDLSTQTQDQHFLNAEIFNRPSREWGRGSRAVGGRASARPETPPGGSRSAPGGGWGERGPGRRAPTAPGGVPAPPPAKARPGSGAPALTNGRRPRVSPADRPQTKSASPPARRAPPTAGRAPRLTKAGPARSAPPRTKAARPAGRHRCSRRRPGPTWPRPPSARPR